MKRKIRATTGCRERHPKNAVRRQSEHGNHVVGHRLNEPSGCSRSRSRATVETQRAGHSKLRTLATISSAEHGCGAFDNGAATARPGVSIAKWLTRRVRGRPHDGASFLHAEGQRSGEPICGRDNDELQNLGAKATLCRAKLQQLFMNAMITGRSSEAAMHAVAATFGAPD